MSDHEIKPGFYRHHKGDAYRVLRVSKNANNQSEVVEYVGSNGGDWHLPVDEFTRTMDGGARRFTLIEANDEPVSPEWFLSVAGDDVEVRGDRMSTQHLILWKDGSVSVLIGAMPDACELMAAPVTKGALRRKCGLAGIELKVPE